MCFPRCPIGISARTGCGWRPKRCARVGGVIACAEEPFGPRLAGRIADAALRPAALRRAARFAAAFGDGWLMPMGYELAAPDRMDARRDAPADLPPAAPFDLARISGRPTRRAMTGAPVLLSGPGADAIVFQRSERLTLANASLDRPARVTPAALAAGRAGDWRAGGDAGAGRGAQPAASRVRRRSLLPRPPRKGGATQAARRPRIGIEAVTPLVDGGRFAATRIAGEVVTVEADVVCDGHDQLGVALRWRAGRRDGVARDAHAPARQ